MDIIATVLNLEAITARYMLNFRQVVTSRDSTKGPGLNPDSNSLCCLLVFPMTVGIQ